MPRSMLVPNPERATAMEEKVRNRSAITKVATAVLRRCFPSGWKPPAAGDTLVLGLEHLKGLSKLTSLHLGGDAINGIGLLNLEDLPVLRALILDKTLVDDAGLKHIKGLTHLQELSLDHTA